MAEESKTINIFATGAGSVAKMAFRGLSDEEDEDGEDANDANDENLPLDDGGGVADDEEGGVEI